MPRRTTLAPERAMKAVPVALLLSLSACHPLGEYQVPEGTFQVGSEDGKVWRPFQVGISSSLYLDANASPHLVFSGTWDKAPSHGTDNFISATVDLRLRPTALGKGPSSLPLEGTADIPQGLSGSATFTGTSQHSPEVVEMRISTLCFGGDNAGHVQQEFRGQLVLDENSQQRLRGRLLLESWGPTTGPCPGRDARVHLLFDILR